MTDTTSAMREEDWRNFTITAGLLADIFDGFCGADGYNLVLSHAQKHESALTAPAQAATINVVGMTAAQASANSLYEAIKHGDQEHRAWLKEALDNWFAGKPVPPPRSAPAQADIHATTDDEINLARWAHRLAYRASGKNIPTWDTLADRSQAMWLEEARKQLAALKAHSPTPPQ